MAEAEEALADPAVAGVVIASPTDTHADLLKQAISAGKAVFCEKPISLDFSTARELTSHVEASGIPVMLGFQRRYDPNFRAPAPWETLPMISR